ncbi:MAG: hypothetical protein ABSD11_15300 [Methylocella sp.]
MLRAGRFGLLRRRERLLLTGGNAPRFKVATWSNFAQIFAHQSASRSPMANAIEAAYSLIINAYAVPSIIVLAATAMLVLGRR